MMASQFTSTESRSRDNLAANAAYNDLATAAIPNADEDTFFSFAIDLTSFEESPLEDGTNVLAVEIHQAAVDSSDVSFDLRLLGGMVNHSPYLQLGNAPLTGSYGGGPKGQTDQVQIMWQTIPNSDVFGAATESFELRYREVGAGSWISTDDSGPPISIARQEIAIENGGVGHDPDPQPTEGRTMHSVTITGLDWYTDYEYELIHRLDGDSEDVVDSWAGTFRTRLKGGDGVPPSSFTFAAYGDSADPADIEDFIGVQELINDLDALEDTDVSFTVLMGDSIYEDGWHFEYDSRFDPSINEATPAFNRNHIECMAFGNHEISQSGSGAPGHDGTPTLDNYSVPIPVENSTSPVAGPNGETGEHNYSFDYGDVHFATFDTNGRLDSGTNGRLDKQLAWLVADMQASNARWKIVFGHHNILGEDGTNTGDPSTAYVQKVITALNAAGVDLFLVGHEHNYQRSFPIQGYLPTPTDEYDIKYVQDKDNDYRKGDGFVQVLAGMGGRSRDPIPAGNEPDAFNAAVFGSDTTPDLEYGFVQIDVTPLALTIRYLGVESGLTAPLDEFTITRRGEIDDTPIVAEGASWKYRDDGSNQGTSWRGTSYNDSGWSSGNAELGYGDGAMGQTTVVNCGPDDIPPICQVDNYATTYFRKTVNIANAALYGSYRGTLEYDDAAAVYINGVEVARTPNLPANSAYDFYTGIDSPIDNAPFTFDISDTSMFVNGNNVIAVEIHQGDSTSSDISFEFTLTGVFRLGDFDEDGAADMDDIVAMTTAIRTSSSAAVYDLNMSGGTITSLDKDFLIREVMGTQYGDADLDKIVGIADLSIVAVNFGETSAVEWNHGNFDNDTDVDITDLSTVATWFGFDNSGGGGSSPFSSSIDIYDDGGTDVGDGLYKYIVTLETSGETDIQAIQLTIVADDAGTLNQQYPDICCGPMATLFQDNNLYFPYDENVDLDHDSQWLWETVDLMIIWEDYESNVLTAEDDDQLIGTFAVGPAAGFLSRNIAQIVLPEGKTATVTGTIAFADGTYEEVGPFEIGASEFFMGGGGSGSSVDLLNEASSRAGRRDERRERRGHERRVVYAGGLLGNSRQASEAERPWGHIRRAIEWT